VASQHIEINAGQSRLSAKVRAAVDNTRRVVDELDRVLDEMNQTSSGGDWAALAASFGWAEGHASNTNAEAVYNLLAGAKGAISDSATVSQFTDRLA
jgi:hypothetical protein